MATGRKLLALCEPNREGVVHGVGLASCPIAGPAGTERIHQIHSLLVFFAGEALLESNTIIDHVYCSPSLRCVQTAYNILKGKI